MRAIATSKTNFRAQLVLSVFVLTLSTVLAAQELYVSEEGEIYKSEESYEPIEEHTPHVTDEELASMKIRLQENIQMLRVQGKLENSLFSSEPITQFIWPVKAADHVTDFNVDALNAFVDQDQNDDQEMDYYCGDRTYDGHRGTDIGMYPFSRHKMNNNDVEVIAAAPGLIVDVEDGNSDLSCGDESVESNYVSVLHDDGSVSGYWHLKKDSITKKNIGDRVEAGEYLGVVGSSGTSGPHLHFKLDDPFDIRNDPFQGACNTMNSTSSSWWADQPGYYVPRINKLATATDSPVDNPCPIPDTTNLKSTFIRGAEGLLDSEYPITFIAFYRDRLGSLPTTHTVFSPDGTARYNWESTTSSDHRARTSASKIYKSFPDDSEQTGIWKFSGNFNDVHYETEFYVVDSCPPSATVTNPSISDRQTYSASDTVDTFGTVSITGSGEVTLLAQNSVTLNPGFSVSPGGTLIVRTNKNVCD